MITRAELWNGNREEWRNLRTLDPETNIVRWAWTQHSKYHERAVAEEGAIGLERVLLSRQCGSCSAVGTLGPAE
jgi:hypothetical protein